MADLGSEGRVAGGRGLRARSWALLVVIALLVVVFDAASKAWVRRALVDGPAEFGPLDLVLGSNTGVAFGVGSGAPRWLVLTVTALIVGVLAFVALRLRPAPAAGLVVGGGVGNLVDRIGDGRVTDYLSVGWWPAFNLADTAICFGAAWLLLATWRSERSSARRPRLEHNGERKERT